MSGDIMDAIVEERRRRLAKGGKGSRKAYHYWRERGDDEPPMQEWWCDYCAGYFGVPHDDWVHTGDLCSNIGRFPGNRQCACIDCVVWEQECERQR